MFLCIKFHFCFKALDAQELSFLHLKVCRTWKTKLTKEEALQKRIDSLESELIHKQRHAQQHSKIYALWNFSNSYHEALSLCIMNYFS